MSATIAFIERLLLQGEAVFHDKPAFPKSELPALCRLLDDCYDRYRPSVAGPLLPFDVKAATAAATFLTCACWALVGDDPPETLEKNLRLEIQPVTAEAHLSADLTLRHLSTVYRRIRARSVEDPLQRSVVDVLRRWPLSGALADIGDPPIGELHFDNHYGLQLLYAERLAACWRASWLPPDGRAREVLEMVLQRQGKTLTVPETEGKT